MIDNSTTPSAGHKGTKIRVKCFYKCCSHEPLQTWVLFWKKDEFYSERVGKKQTNIRVSIVNLTSLWSQGWKHLVCCWVLFRVFTVSTMGQTQRAETSASRTDVPDVSEPLQTTQLQVWCRWTDAPAETWDNNELRNTVIHEQMSHFKNLECGTFDGQISFTGSSNVLISSFAPSGWNWGKHPDSFTLREHVSDDLTRRFEVVIGPDLYEPKL